MSAAALIQEIGALGARLELDGDDIRLIKPKGVVVPAGLLEAARDAKAEIRKALSGPKPECADAADRDECAAIMEADAGVPRRWADYLAQLSKGPPPGDFQERHWQAVIDGALLFADEWAGRACALGWSPHELFGMDAVAPAARVDRRGLAFMLSSGARVVGIDERGADILMPGGTRQRFYRAASNRLPPATAAAATDEIDPVASVGKSQVSQTPIRQKPAKQAGSVAAIASVAGVVLDPAAEGHAEDQAKRVCDTCDSATPHVHPVEHRIELTAASRDRASMRYRGEVIGESREPLFAAARYLLAKGLASPEDRIETWRGKTMCLAGPVGAAAKLTVNGYRFQRYRAE